ncbi:MAG: Gfo/Idh/MocA family oxidoreductase [Acidobacteriota bacterium]
MATSVSRVALVGLGNAGSTLHLPALQALPSAQVVSAFDPDRGSRERAASRFKVPVSDSFERLLESSPDVVIVASPPETHADYTLRAIERGAHVFCEKPFVSSLEQADAIIAAAAAKGRQVAVNHEFRHMPIFKRVIDEVAADGALRFVQVWQLMDLPPWVEPGWRGQMVQRTLYEAGVHLVDLVIAMFRERPVAVSTVTSSCAASERPTDAVALVTLEFSGGRLAQIIQNRLCKGETQYVEVRADTASASWRASFGGRARIMAGLHRSPRPKVRVEYGLAGIAWREQGHTRKIVARNASEPGMLATREALRQSLEAFASGGRPATSAQDARDVHEVIAACYHAAAVGRRLVLGSDELRALTPWRLGAPPV